MSLSVDGVGVRGEVCGPALEVEGRGVSISSSYVSVASSGTVVAAMHIKQIWTINQRLVKEHLIVDH